MIISMKCLVKSHFGFLKYVKAEDVKHYIEIEWSSENYAKR